MYSRGDFGCIFQQSKINFCFNLSSRKLIFIVENLLKFKLIVNTKMRHTQFYDTLKLLSTYSTSLISFALFLNIKTVMYFESSLETVSIRRLSEHLCIQLFGLVTKMIILTLVANILILNSNSDCNKLMF